MHALKDFAYRHSEGLVLSLVMAVVLGNVLALATGGADVFRVWLPMLLGWLVAAGVMLALGLLLLRLMLR